MIEVSDSTIARDRGTKCRSYARAGVQNYWIVDVEARAVEVYTDPGSAAGQPSFGTVARYAETETIQIIIDGKPMGSLLVGQIFP